MDVLFLEKNYSKINFKKKIKYFSLSKYNFEYGLIILAFIEYLKSNFKYSIRFFYLLTFLKKYRPKIIIGNQFNFSLFRIKSFYPEITTIMYFQYAMTDNQFKEYIEKNFNKKRKIIDYILAPTEQNQKYLRKYIQTNFIASGFLKNNEVKLKKVKKKYDLMIISEYRNNMDKKKEKVIKSALSKLSKIINNKKIKVCIALASSRPEKKINQKDEISFFKKFNFKFDILKIGSYELANKSKMIFSINSNLGYELLSRKFKVLFFTNGQEPYLKKYPFICRIVKLEKIFERLNKIKKKDFKRVLENKNINFVYDKENKILKSLVNKNLL